MDTVSESLSSRGHFGTPTSNVMISADPAAPGLRVVSHSYKLSGFPLVGFIPQSTDWKLTACGLHSGAQQKLQPSPDRLCQMGKESCHKVHWVVDISHVQTILDTGIHEDRKIIVRPTMKYEILNESSYSHSYSFVSSFLLLPNPLSYSIILNLLHVPSCTQVSF